MFTTHFVGKKRKQNKKWQADRTGFCPLPQVISVLFLEDNNLSSREGWKIPSRVNKKQWWFSNSRNVHFVSILNPKLMCAPPRNITYRIKFITEKYPQKNSILVVFFAFLPLVSCIINGSGGGGRHGEVVGNYRVAEPLIDARGRCKHSIKLTPLPSSSVPPPCFERQPFTPNLMGFLEEVSENHTGRV